MYIQTDYTSFHKYYKATTNKKIDSSMKNYQIYRLVILSSLILIVCSSCGFWGKEKKWKPIKPVKHAFVHTVQWPDETMALISMWYTGDSKNAERLAEANPTVNADRLTLGTVIYIPKKLLRKRTPMTRQFLDNSKTKVVKKKVTKPKPKVVAPKTKDEPEAEFELFGPR